MTLASLLASLVLVAPEVPTHGYAGPLTAPAAPLHSLPAVPDPPVGSYALTAEFTVVIRESAEGWTLRIGDGDPHALVSGDAGEWTAPDLGLTVGLAAGNEEGAVKLHRYGHSVVAPRIEAESLPDYEAMETLDVIQDLVPRLMIALDVPGVSIAVVRDRDVHSLVQFGVKTAGQPDRVDAGSVFEAASMSKPAYAYPFMKLVEEGVMELDRPLVEYLGRDYLEGDELHRQITARMVLTHTTGFPNWRRGGELTVNFAPGSQLGYSGEGFQFLQTAVEAVTGLSTEAFAQERLLRPLGMSASSYEWQPRYEETYATGHTADGQPRDRRPYQSANTAYTLYTTPEDFARLLIEIMAPDPSGPHSLQRETVAAMLTPELHVEERNPIDRGNDDDAEVHFALGWRLDRLESGDRVWHSGSNSTGFQCYAEFDPGAGHGIVVMTNSSSGSPLWRALMRQIGTPSAVAQQPGNPGADQLRTAAQTADPLFPTATPEEVGMSSEKLDAALQAARAWVEGGEIGGGVLLVIRHGRKVLHEAFGLADLETGEPMTTDAIFLTASMTKPMTGTAVLQLYERGLIELDDRAAEYVPEFDTPATREITIRQLLTHTSGLEAWTSGLESGSHGTLVRSIAQGGTRTEPGSEFHYSDRGTTVLGYLVERVSGQPLLEYITEHILEPLEMNDSYVTTHSADPRLARVPPRYDVRDGELELWQTGQGIDRSFLGGSGGLYSTTLDYARFLEAFRQGGRLGHVRLLSEETVHYATRKHEARPDGMYDYGLHWGIGLRGLTCDAISHGGSRGTIAYLDRDHDLMVLYFTQTRRTPTRVPLVQLVHEAIVR